MKISRYCLALCVIAAMGTMSCVYAEKQKKEDTKKENRKKGKGKQGKGRGKGAHNRGRWGGPHFVGIDDTKLRTEIKNAWNKFEEYRKFERELFKGKKGKRGKFKDEATRKEHIEKKESKMAELGLSLELIDKLRELSNLNHDERLAINRIEHKLTAHEKMQQKEEERTAKPAEESVATVISESEIPEHAKPAYGARRRERTEREMARVAPRHEAEEEEEATIK